MLTTAFLIATIALLLLSGWSIFYAKFPSTATFGMSALIYGIISLAYAVSYWATGDWGAYHRWLTVLLAPLNVLLQTRGYILLFRSRLPVWTRLVFWPWMLAIVALALYFALNTVDAPKVRNAYGSWDFTADQPSMIVALFISLSGFIMWAAAFLGPLTAMMVRSTTYRAIAFLFTFGMNIVMMVPSYLRKWALGGSMHFDTYTIAALAIMTCCFTILCVGSWKLEKWDAETKVVV